MGRYRRENGAPSDIEEETFGSRVGRGKTTGFGERVDDEEVVVLLLSQDASLVNIEAYNVRDREQARTSWLRRLAAPKPLSTRRIDQLSDHPRAQRHTHVGPAPTMTGRRDDRRRVAGSAVVACKIESAGSPTPREREARHSLTDIDRLVRHCC